MQDMHEQQNRSAAEMAAVWQRSEDDSRRREDHFNEVCGMFELPKLRSALL